MNAETWGALIAAVLGSGLLTAVTNNVWQRRRQRADTVAILNETALELLVPLRGEIKELRGEMTGLRQQVGVYQRREHEQIQALSVHAQWDMAVQKSLLEAGSTYPPVPALFPTFNTRRERTRAEDYDLPDTRPGTEEDNP